MTQKSAYTTFYFEGYTFDRATRTATFSYSFDGELRFSETITFELSEVLVDEDVLERCLELALIVVGTSYYKCFPVQCAEYRGKQFSRTQAEFINYVYRDGLSQFIFENHLDPDALLHVDASSEDAGPLQYDGEGVLSLQSGGKDSLLLGQLLNGQGINYASWYMTSSETYPKVIARLRGIEPRLAHRSIDRAALACATDDGALNGHVPITYIALAYALIDVVIHGENTVLAAIGAEGDEPHAMAGNLPVKHQWSKTWEAEVLFSKYVTSLISPDLHVGSPLRSFSELRIAELFQENCWDQYAHEFSSCNRANYIQGESNTNLKWCGVCPKCANTFLLFAPFVEPQELRSLFGGVNLLTSSNSELTQSFKGLLGIDGVMKPLECVGEIEELRTACSMAVSRYGSEYVVSFDVPAGQFEYCAKGPSQDWAHNYLPPRLR